ncbi:Acyl-N-acyltransferase [Cordyceps militaris]|uniref:Acyl-N-acyltransferase n=1 Tax=Cordyceps militaris TaxID=73501 RepID=A0A2H4SHV7_CORMI|nr:Acyl-N-acyltransferase [Cordyceps militaris]
MIEVRKATLAETADIIRIGRKVFAKTFGHSVPDYELRAYLDSAYTEPLISAEVEDATKDVLVAIQHGGESHDSIAAGPDRSSSSSSSSSGGDDSDNSATTDGVVVGFAQLTRGTSAAEPCVATLPHAASSVELQRLYVDLSHHGQGIGRRLAGAVEDIARGKGSRTCGLACGRKIARPPVCMPSWATRPLGFMTLWWEASFSGMTF